MRANVASVAAAAASLAVAAVGAVECGCENTCRAYGDPHVIDFHGNKWIEKATPTFTLYQQGAFAVTADTFSRHWMHKITFGKESVSLDVCTHDGQIAASWENAFKADNKAVGVGKSKLKADVTCRTPKDGPVNERPKFVLNIALWKWNEDLSGAEMTFLDAEKRLGSTGACLGKSSGRLADADADADADAEANATAYAPADAPSTRAPGTCGCTAVCKLQGDPHLDSFYGFHAKLKDTGSALNMYKDDALSVDAELGDTWYIQKLTVGTHKTYSVEGCSETATQLPSITVPANGGSITIDVACKLPGNRKLRKLGWHLDVTVSKLDSGRGSFPDQERAVGPTGVCTRKP